MRLAPQLFRGRGGGWGVGRGNETEIFQERVNRVKLICVKQKLLAWGERQPGSGLHLCLQYKHIKPIACLARSTSSSSVRSSSHAWTEAERLKTPGGLCEKQIFFSYINLPFSFFPRFTIQDQRLQPPPAAATGVRAGCWILAVFQPFKSLFGCSQADEGRVRRSLSGFYYSREAPRLLQPLCGWVVQINSAHGINQQPQEVTRTCTCPRASFSWVLDNVHCGDNQSRPFFPGETPVICHLLLWGKEILMRESLRASCLRSRWRGCCTVAPTPFEAVFCVC